jgi:hypothetical protein
MIAASFAADFTGLPLYRLNIGDWEHGHSATAAFDTALALNKYWRCIFLLEDPFSGLDTRSYQGEASIAALSGFMDECRGVFILLTVRENSLAFRESAIASRIGARFYLPSQDSAAPQRLEIWKSLLQTIARDGSGLDNEENLQRLQALAIREPNWRQIQSNIRSSLAMNPDNAAGPTAIVDWQLLGKLANLELIC